MLNIPCPSCGAQVQFISKASIFAVCTHCRSTLLRQDLTIQHIGQMAVLQNDNSPIQLHSVGFFNNQRFEVIGRLQKKWSGGSWNEWYLYFDGIKEGWLAEAQGFYMVSFKVETPTQLPERESLRAGQIVNIDSTTYTVDDIKDVRCSFSEGELPFQSDYGKESRSVDCSAPNGNFACLDYEDDKIKCYLGRYQEFDAFRFSNLKDLDGW